MPNKYMEKIQYYSNFHFAFLLQNYINMTNTTNKQIINLINLEHTSEHIRFNGPDICNRFDVAEENALNCDLVSPFMRVNNCSRLHYYNFKYL